MDYRTEVILRELMSHHSPITGKSLANKLDVTSRTIRDDIKDINDELAHFGASIRSKRGVGYDLLIEDPKLFRAFINELTKDSDLEESLPTTPDSRLTYMMKRFLLMEDYIKLDDLAEEMHVSKSTLQMDLKHVKDHLRKYSLDLTSRPGYGLKLSGSELNRRFAMSQYLFNRENLSLDLMWLDQLAPLISLSQDELNDLWTLLLEQLRLNQVTLSDIAINNLFVHIVIAYKRIVEGHHIDLVDQDIQTIRDKREYRVADNIVKEMEKALHVTFPKIEIVYIAIHLMGTKLVNEDRSMNQEIETVMDESIHELTLQMLEAVENKFSLGIANDKELIIGLGLHLKPAINRYNFGMTIRNPMLEDIKNNYPLAFEAGIIAALVLDDKLNVSIDENEVAYLALHIGAAIERKKAKNGPKKCYIVCASGVGSAQLIRYRIESEFQNQIKVIGTTDYYKIQSIPFDETDFIISSVPIKEDLPIPVIEVNAILGSKDISKIDQFVAFEEKSITDYFPEENVFLNQSFKSKDEVINFLADYAQTVDQLPDNYTQLIYEREKIAPTAYGNMIAIPHPISPQTTQTFLTVCTLKKPIEWAERRVQFVCLLNVEKNSQEDLQDMYGILGRIVNDEKLIQKLISSQSYHAFIQTLLRIEE